MEGWFWIVVLAVALVAELITEQLVSIWFVPGALVASILGFVDAPIYWQIIAFLVLSIIGVFVFRRFLSKFFKREVARTGVDAIIGEKCVVTEKISNFAGCGQAKVKGQVWSARGCSDDDVFEEGEVLQIVAIEGVKLICKRI
ncbi:MAG: NfeD family protein [Clostridia bacterium]|nr:NfeD family protein [Clostridia bacterium]